MVLNFCEKNLHLKKKKKLTSFQCLSEKQQTTFFPEACKQPSPVLRSSSSQSQNWQADTGLFYTVQKNKKKKQIPRVSFTPRPWTVSALRRDFRGLVAVNGEGGTSKKKNNYCFLTLRSLRNNNMQNQMEAADGPRFTTPRAKALFGSRDDFF